MRYREVRSRGCDDVDSAAVAMVPVVLRLEEDCRERMVYLAHLYFESAIRDYVPSSEDIDYPRKLYGIHSSNASNSDFYAKKRQMESRSSPRGLLSYSENLPVSIFIVPRETPSFPRFFPALSTFPSLPPRISPRVPMPRFLPPST